MNVREKLFPPGRAGVAWMWIGLLLAAGAAPTVGQSLPGAAYWLYVAAESEDQVALIRFDSHGLEVVKTIDVSVRSTEIDGPHGVRVSPDGEHWYVSLAHGNPFGSVHKFRTGTDEWEGAVEVGMFPATMDVAASTGLLYVVNFDLHGGMTPGTISVVDVESMTEVARIEAGVMPHGSRLNRDEDRHYAVMMMSDELVETDARAFGVIRRLSLTGSSSGAAGVESPHVKPTWVEPAPDGEHLYVALNGANEIVEVDVDAWEVSGTFDTGQGPYNLAVSPDGRWLVASYRTESSTGIWDLASRRERARIPNSRGLTHGVAISPDSRYAFVSVEGTGGEPGGVDVFDLDALRRVGSVDVGKQASGIALWKMER